MGVKLKHASGNGTVIGAPAANPSADITLKAPSTTGSAGQVLSVASANHSSTNAELEWATVSVTVDKIEEGNTSAEVVDTGSDGHFKVTTEGSERIRVLAGGNALFGATSATDGASIIEAHGGNMDRPLLTKTATTNSNYSLMCQNDNGIVGSISTAGSGTAFNTSSDYRLKENVVNLTGGISRLKTLKPKRFNFKADASTTLDGFLAHEVTAVPEAIFGVKDAVDSDDKIIPQGLDHSRLVPLLTAALQEAITKIETLETKVAALEGS